MKPKNLCVAFGGRSVEHDVSVITGLQVIAHADKSRYRIIPLYISQAGKFLTAPASETPETLLKTLLTHPTPARLDIETKSIATPRNFLGGRTNIPIDVVFPAFHGTFGEDGSFQGLLEIMNVPYVGSGVLASAIGMNKNALKRLLQVHGVPVLEGYVIKKETPLEDIRIPFSYPVIAKPVNLGSSIGVKKVANATDLRDELEVIFRLDAEALIEPFLERMMEINCAVLGSPFLQEASVCEQPVSAKEVLSFEDKYLKGGKKTKSRAAGMASLDRRIPAPISKERTEEIQRLAKRVFALCGAAGVARVDCMIDEETGNAYVNEINTIPGSMSFYLWEASGMSFRELIDRLVAIAEEEHARKRDLERTFESAVLKKLLDR